MNFELLLERANKRIGRSWKAGCVMGVFFILISAAISQPTQLHNVLYIATIFALSYGIYKKSRVASCALLSLTLFHFLSILINSNFKYNFAMAWLFIFSIFFVQGVIGSFSYHKLMSSKNDETSKENGICDKSC